MYIGFGVGQSMAWHDRARLGMGWGGSGRHTQVGRWMGDWVVVGR